MNSLSAVEQALEKARKDLLELSTRSRLLHTPLENARSSFLRISGESSHEVFNYLVTQQGAATFLPQEEEEAEEDPESSDSADAEPGEEEDLPIRNGQSGLQTNLSSDKLDRRLLRIFYDARTVEEEQGVNILYIALGFLKWYESESSEIVRLAPLILVPVTLDRRSARSRFVVRYTDEDIATNLSLQAKLHQEFGLELPDLPDTDDVVPSEYFASVQQMIANVPRWEVVCDEIALGFYSFAKYLMYRDLDPKNWPNDRPLVHSGVVSRLLQDGFEGEPPFDGGSQSIDSIIPVPAMTHVRDADSSQALAIEHVRRGKPLVVQGPPGTGKSQTICNMIAAAIKEKKKVLFVAEKMAALDVVHRRLEEIGLGAICLEIHSNKAKKKAVLDELGKTLELGSPVESQNNILIRELETIRTKLNQHDERLHTPLSPSGWTPYQILGELVRGRQRGIVAGQIELADCEKWTSEEMRMRRSLLQDVVHHAEAVGAPSQSCWRGVTVAAVLPTDVQRLVQRWQSLLDRLTELGPQIESVAKMIGGSIEASTNDAMKLCRLCLLFAAAPDMDRERIADDVWQTQRGDIQKLINAVKGWNKARHELCDIVSDVAWTTDLKSTRKMLMAYGRSWFRWFNKDYRDAVVTLRGLLTGPAPKPLEDRVALIDSIIAAQKAKTWIDQKYELGQKAFGSFWQGDSSDASRLEAIVEWESKVSQLHFPPTIRKLLKRIADAEALHHAATSLSQAVNETTDELKAVFRSMQIDLDTLFETSRRQNDAIKLEKVPYKDLMAKLRDWLADPEGLSRWIAFRQRWLQFSREPVAPLPDLIFHGRISSTEAIGQFTQAYFESLMRFVLHIVPEFAAFSGQSHQRLVEEFRRLDRDRIALARREVAMAHFESMPKGSSQIGELGVIRAEIAKKRRHLPIRKLLAKAGRAVQAIKPVFMMSPLSIAQFLEAGGLHFDLLLIDEASQVRPVDALGAAARAEQIVVVGDDKQLPPSRFFAAVLDDESTPEGDEQLQVTDLESILGLCTAKGMPRRMLGWHYRSRHHSLISLSNYEFYENRLHVLPSPLQAGPELGLQFQYVSDGCYDRGKSATNRVEAKRVAVAVMEHVQNSPTLSLGVAAFSTSQRDAILDELELLRRENPQFEDFFISAHPAERFFVKNLENVQGDERDVIIISVGYGPDAAGYMTMNFGPLSNDGGERRLNVLITRAKTRCVVFSSITDEQIDSNRARGRGAQALKAFLRYARTQELGGGAGPMGDCESPFEEAVAAALEAEGFVVTPQVGVAGFFIDLAVSDPETPGRYILGIECDGASYHSSRSARDRDRLRQECLENQGWVLHRIWSTDWFQRPEDELRRAVAAIEAARIEMVRRVQAPTHASSGRDGLAASSVERGQSLPVPEKESIGIAVVPYEEANFGVPNSKPIHEIALHRLAEIVHKIIAVEQPVHIDEVARRVTTLWGQSRTGARIVKAVKRAVRATASASGIRIHDDFCSFSGSKIEHIRTREAVISATLRKPEMLPLDEVSVAVKSVVATTFGAPRDELYTVVARLFGFKSTSAQLRERIDRAIDRLVESHVLYEREGVLSQANTASDVSVPLPFPMRQDGASAG